MTAALDVSAFGEDGLEGVRLIPEEQFVLHEIIGSGGFAEVYKATWILQHQVVAVKRLRILPRERQMWEAFCKEIRELLGRFLPIFSLTECPPGSLG